MMLLTSRICCSPPGSANVSDAIANRQGWPSHPWMSQSFLKTVPVPWDFRITTTSGNNGHKLLMHCLKLRPKCITNFSSSTFCPFPLEEKAWSTDCIQTANKEKTPQMQGRTASVSCHLLYTSSHALSQFPAIPSSPLEEKALPFLNCITSTFA